MTLPVLVFWIAAVFLVSGGAFQFNAAGRPYAAPVKAESPVLAR